MCCGFSKQKCFHNELSSLCKREKIKTKRRKKKNNLKLDEFLTKAGLWYRPHVTDGRSPVIKLVHSFTVLVSPNLPPLASLGAAAVKNSFPISTVSHFQGSTYIYLWAGLIKVWDSTKKELKAYHLQPEGVTPRHVKSKWNLGTL